MNLPGATLTEGSSSLPGRRKATWKMKMMLVGISLLLCLVVLLAGEVYCRYFVDIHFLGNSRELFIDKAYGESMGHARNSRGISFGQEVFTDVHGFRCEPEWKQGGRKQALLLLGDSVVFGPGVEESQTLAGRLRRHLPEVQIYNSSVIGYALADYRNVVQAFVPDHPEIKRVCLVMCLNDISRQSAQNIYQFLQEGGNSDRVDQAKSMPWIGGLNAWLRERSKLYLVVKTALTNPRQRFFLNDLALYQVNEPTFTDLMQPVAEVHRMCQQQDIEFVLVLAPAEPQVRTRNTEWELPQRRVAAYLQQRGIPYFDPLPAFREHAGDASSLYLRGDALHFSAGGFDVLFRAIVEQFKW